MKYKNPIIKGMYPDPSICSVNGEYYLVTSTFEYFPGVPVFKSNDLINWTQIGHCLTRESQFKLSKSPCSGGIFAPTLRYHNNKFYMITTCFSEFSREGIVNFFVTAENIEGPWSEATVIDIDGIDPSLFWEDDKTYVQYTNFGHIMQAEIDINTGKVLKGPVNITDGCGGRDAEGPHIWKRDGFYYLLLAEGGTKSGHMVTMMRANDIWGPYEESPYNPILTNKDKAHEEIQCVGHSDWVVDEKGNDYLVSLGVREVDFKNILGRETMLTPAYWTEDGWLRSKYGYMKSEFEVDIDTVQRKDDDFELNMNLKEMPQRIIMKRVNKDNYEFLGDSLKIIADRKKLSDMMPSFWGLRQTEFDFKLESEIKFDPKDEDDEAGLALTITDECHMSIFISKRNNKKSVVLRKKVRDISCESENEICDDGNVVLIIKGNKEKYEFYYVSSDGNEILLGDTYINHLSTDNACSQNTGVVCGMFIAGNENHAIVNKFSYKTI